MFEDAMTFEFAQEGLQNFFAIKRKSLNRTARKGNAKAAKKNFEAWSPSRTLGLLCVLCG
jgi:hypothetical protein